MGLASSKGLFFVIFGLEANVNFSQYVLATTGQGHNAQMDMDATTKERTTTRDNGTTNGREWRKQLRICEKPPNKTMEPHAGGTEHNLC